MGETLDKAREVFRDFVVEGLPQSGEHKPDKEETVELFDIIDESLDAAAGGFLSRKTWAALELLVPAVDGTKGEVTTDAGTHTDPVVGGTVDNEGLYSWHAGSGNGWERTGDRISITIATREEVAEREVDDKTVTPLNLNGALDPIDRHLYGTINQPLLFEDDIIAHAHTTIGDDGVTEEMVGGVLEDGTSVFHIAPYDFKPFEVYVSPTNVEVGAMLGYGVGVQSDLGTILHAPEPYLKRRIRAIVTDFAGNNFPVILDPFNDFAISLHTTIEEMEIIVYWGASNAVGPVTSVPFELGPQVGTAALQGNAQNLIAIGGEDESTVIADEDFNLDPEEPGFTNLHNTVLERPAVAFGNALVRRRYRSRILGQRRVIFTVGKGGKSVTEIGAGTVQYNNIVVAMQRIRALAIREFGCNRFRVRMVTVQGEADTTMAVATYKAHLQEMFDDFEGDMDAVFNDDLTIPTVLVGPVRFYMVQDGLIGASGQGGNPALALVELHDGDKYILASHGYDATFADFVHRDGPGNQHVHEKVAMAFAYREYRGLEWPLLVPGAVSYNAGTRTVSFAFPASPEGTYVESDQGGPSGSDELPAVADGRLGINVVRASAASTKLATDSISFPGAGVVNVVMTAPLIAATAYILKIGRFRAEVTAGTLRPPYEGAWTNLRAESTEASTGADNNSRLQHYYVPQSETSFTTPA